MTASFDAFISESNDPQFAWVVSIHHRQADGLHIFTSDEVHGLVVFSDRKERAIHMLPEVIGELAKRNHDFENCEVTLGSLTTPSPGRKIDQPDFAVIKRAVGG